MPIEIRELHIKAVIDGGGKKESEGQPSAAAPAAPAPEMNELIDLCVEKILEILKEKTER
jgi:hypothetical protein